MPKPPNMTCLMCPARYYVLPYRLAKGLGRYCGFSCRSKGRVVSDDTRAKMRVAQGARGPRSQETKARMSAAQTVIAATRDHSSLATHGYQPGRIVSDAERRDRGERLREALRVKAGGIFKYETDDAFQRKLPEYKQWRTAVFERDNYTCNGCRVVGGYLEAHHVLPWSTFPDRRFDVSNGITVCLDCHELIDPLRARFKKRG